MARRLKGKLVVGQGGGPTAVINRSLVGVIHEAAQREEIEDVYGMVHGIEGILDENLIDLRKEAPETIDGLLHAPASALGSCRHKVVAEDYTRILEVFKAHNVRYFVYIGGNDSMDTAYRVGQLAESEGYELRVMGVPKTIDNDLDLTDHTPGYGSAARFLTMATMDVGRDLEAMQPFDDVIILEALGRNAGWLPAATILAKQRPEDAPHLIYVPERAFHEDEFLEDVRAVHRELGRVFVVISAYLYDEEGGIVGVKPGSLQKDAFGHSLMSQSSNSVAGYLRSLVAKEVGIKARIMQPSIVGRDFMSCVSQADQAEAYLAGKMAIAKAVRGESGYMVTLVREPGPTYRCTTGLAPLDKVANAEKLLPDEYINERGNGIRESFCEYALPLVGDPLPHYARLEGIRVPRRV